MSILTNTFGDEVFGGEGDAAAAASSSSSSGLEVRLQAGAFSPNASLFGDEEDLLLGNITASSPPAVADKYNALQATLIGLSAGLLSCVTITGNLVSSPGMEKVVADALVMDLILVLQMVMISFKMDKQLQTISNYFLFSLAVADTIIGSISMPLFTLYILQQSWTLGRTVCDAWLSVDYLASNASVLNLLIISFDRYFSVTRPLTYR